MSHNSTNHEILSFIRAANDAWTKADGSRLNEYFHPRMVAITPVDRLRRLGAAECIAGWQGFARNAIIDSWTEREHDVQLHSDGNVAIVTYYYDMDVIMSGARFPLSGRDMMTLIKENARWWIVADQFSSFPG